MLRWFPGRLPVICCPFLSEGEPVLLDLVLGLQRACNLLKEQSDMQDKVLGEISNLSAVGGGVASCCELHAAAGLALHLQLDQAEVVACTSAMWSTSNISIKVMGFTSGIFTTNLFQRHPWPACQCRSRMGVPCLCKMIMCENHPLPAHFRFSFMESNDCL